MKRPLTAKRRGVTGDTERKGTGSIRHSAEGREGALASCMCQHLSLNTSIIAGTDRASQGCWNVVLKNLLPKWFCFIAHQGAVVLILFVPRTVVTAQVPTNMSSRQGSSQPLPSAFAAAGSKSEWWGHSSWQGDGGMCSSLLSSR